MRQEDGVELRQIFGTIRRWAWLILSCVLVAVCVALVVTSRIPPEYSATTTLLVGGADDPRGSQYTTLIAGQQLALTYSQMLRERSTLQAAIKQLGLETTPEILAKKVKAESVRDTQLIRLTVGDTSPTGAALLADAIANAFTQRVATLQGERYHSEIANAEAEMQAQLAVVQQTQSELDTAAAGKVAEDTELAHLQDHLGAQRAELSSLQRDEQSLQITLNQTADKVAIVEPAQIAVERTSLVCTATVTLLMDPSMVGDGLYSDSLAGTYAQILTGGSVLEAALADVNSGQIPDDLARRVHASPIAGTQLIRLSVWGQDPGLVKGLAGAIASAFVRQIQELRAEPYAPRLANLREQQKQLATQIEQTQAEIDGHVARQLRAANELARLEALLAEERNNYRTYQQNYQELRAAAGQAAGTIVVSERAAVPNQPVGGRTLYILIAAAAAAALGLGAAFALEYVDETIKKPEDVGEVLGVPTVGMIGHFGNRATGLVIVSQAQSPAAEAFRMLAANVRHCIADTPLRTLLVTSSQSGEGKSVVAANLAVALAQAGLRVVAIDADLRVPRLHQLFGLSRSVGLTGALRSGFIDGNLQCTGVEGLAFLASGPPSADPVKELSSPRMAALMAQLQAMADVVVIDSPPLLVVADATVLAAAADGALLVVRAGQARIPGVQAAVAALQQANEHIVGAVLNAVPETRHGYYKYYAHAERTQEARSTKPRQHFGLTGLVKRWLA